MKEMINLKIDDINVSVEAGTTILEAAKKANVRIPTLCYHPDLCIAGNCRICMVEVEGSLTLTAACAMPVSENMVIHTNSLKVRTARKHNIELLLSEHNSECTKCYKNGNCELQDLAAEYKITNETFIDLVPFHNYTIDHYSPAIIKDDSKCIRCQRCVRTCEELQSVSALGVAYKGEHMKISTFMEKSMFDVVCTNCGQCVNRCPVGALVEKNYIDQVWDAIYDPSKHVVLQTAPAVRIALGEDLGYDPGEIVTGKMVAAIKKLGIDSVLDTDFTADLTIMEEGTELLTRLKKALVDKDSSVALPMMTSCSPGWIKFIEHQFPQLLPNLSTCKSPQQMFGALAKTYYAQKRNIDPADIVSVSVMPCTAKKFEADRPEMRSSGYKDVDYVLTTRELAVMIKQAGIDFESLKEEKYDSIMGQSTGAAVIFGATGGVMEAALRTAYELVTGREVPFDGLNITPVRGMEGVKEASVKIEGTLPEWKFLEGAILNTAIAHGLVNAKKVMELVDSGKANYHFIEIMACPGGCLGGGGQPIPTNMEIRMKRNKAIYQEDAGMPIRKSHENPEVALIYKEFLEKPLGHTSHKLLHTTYIDRAK
ncbi:MAG: NADH-dependent [FeFe] hydrogenase, group A6 [Bacteroidales bacterium]|jgi:iron-only hydrogenase group A|nr:NADH-dependent [FeFe] hydrogenase, group A6 [Bacteroidales bacterium]MDD3691125.1 NADH-dependent [FeFe] hydrogenase, group A6 [Bacteroidales bacterium]MDD4044771.1 NADH-dependent [FeFe] hydrogenase, group A6 [Bacteroidales bacterium]MDD4580750.1 NADH-dependent [FeFe] hydrogenase, group A6 [Bacteroidales bacterium]MDX9890066.1 NADH-dependent [FeFe] hydrogenase, group A6 [Bacteroidales bacterium]